MHGPVNKCAPSWAFDFPDKGWKIYLSFEWSSRLSCNHRWRHCLIETTSLKAFPYPRFWWHAWNRNPVFGEDVVEKMPVSSNVAPSCFAFAVNFDKLSLILKVFGSISMSTGTKPQHAGSAATFRTLKSERMISSPFLAQIPSINKALPNCKLALRTRTALMLSARTTMPFRLSGKSGPGDQDRHVSFDTRKKIHG